MRNQNNEIFEECAEPINVPKTNHKSMIEHSLENSPEVYVFNIQ